MADYSWLYEHLPERFILKTVDYRSTEVINPKFLEDLEEVAYVDARKLAYAAVYAAAVAVAPGTAHAVATAAAEAAGNIAGDSAAEAGRHDLDAVIAVESAATVGAAATAAAVAVASAGVTPEVAAAAATAAGKVAAAAAAAAASTDVTAKFAAGTAARIAAARNAARQAAAQPPPPPFVAEQCVAEARIKVIKTLLTGLRSERTKLSEVDRSDPVEFRRFMALEGRITALDKEVTALLFAISAMSGAPDTLPSRLDNVDFNLVTINPKNAVGRMCFDTTGNTIARVFEERVRGSVFCVDEVKGKYVVWSDTKRLWLRVDRGSIVMLIGDVMHWAQEHCGKMLSLSGTPQLEKLVRMLMIAPSTWIDQLDGAKHAMPAKNGLHVDLKTGVARKRERGDMWTFELNCELLELNETALPLAVEYVKSVSKDADGNFLPRMYSQLRCVMGHVLPGVPSEWKRVIVLVGISDTGKTVFIDMMSLVCEPGVVSASIIMETGLAVRGPHDHTGGLAPIKMHRWVRLSEANTRSEKVTKIDVASLDLLVSEPRVPLRDVGQLQATAGTPNRAQLVMSTNKVPALPADDEDRQKLLRKLFCVQFMHHFKKEDPVGIAYLDSLKENPAFRNQFFTLMVMCSMEQQQRTPEERKLDQEATELAVGLFSTSSTQKFAAQCVQKSTDEKVWMKSSHLQDVYYWWCQLVGAKVERAADRLLTAQFGPTTVRGAVRGRPWFVWADSWLATLSEKQQQQLKDGNVPVNEVVVEPKAPSAAPSAVPSAVPSAEPSAEPSAAPSAVGVTP